MNRCPRNCACALVVLCLNATWQAGLHAEPPRQLLDRLPRGGLCLWLTAAEVDTDALAAAAGRDGMLVHGLVPEARALAVARGRLHAKRLYGQVTLQLADSLKRLPCADGLVNRLFVDDLPAAAKRGLTPEEVARVVCPGGAAVVRVPPGASVPPRFGGKQLQDAGFRVDAREGRPDGWLVAFKSRPDDTDVWTHPRHGPDGNRVSRDLRVGPPATLRWIAPPRFIDRGMRAMLVTRDRLFYLTHDKRPPAQWLVARDAHNGLFLWDRRVSLPPKPTGPFAETSWPLVASDEAVFVLDEGQLLGLDAVTGNLLR